MYAAAHTPHTAYVEVGGQAVGIVFHVPGGFWGLDPSFGSKCLYPQSTLTSPGALSSAHEHTYQPTEQSHQPRSTHHPRSTLTSPQSTLTSPGTLSPAHHFRLLKAWPISFRTCKLLGKPAIQDKVKTKTRSRSRMTHELALTAKLDRSQNPN